jgi:hypothetical protein
MTQYPIRISIILFFLVTINVSCDKGNDDNTEPEPQDTVSEPDTIDTIPKPPAFFDTVKLGTFLLGYNNLYADMPAYAEFQKDGFIEIYGSTVVVLPVALLIISTADSVGEFLYDKTTLGYAGVRLFDFDVDMNPIYTYANTRHGGFCELSIAYIDTVNKTVYGKHNLKAKKDSDEDYYYMNGYFKLKYFENDTIRN